MELNIFQKMSAITNELGVVAKNLSVDMGKGKSYKAVQEKDVLDAVKPIEEKYGVYSYPVERKIVDNDVLTKESEYNGKITKTNTIFMRVETTYRFVNIDKPEEFIDIKTYGDGLDTGDKAPGKAMTYGDKYALLKAYKIATGDDPDKDASPENGYAKEITTKDKIRTYGKKASDKLREQEKKLSELTETEAKQLLKELENED